MESIEFADRTYDQFARAALMAKLKSNMRITSNDLDGILVQDLEAAVDFCEKHIGSVIALSKFTYTQEVTEVPSCSSLSLRLYGPVSPSSVSVTLDGKAVQATLSGRDLTVPVVSTGTLTIAWEAGMKTIPGSIVQAVVMRAAYLFDNPSDAVEEKVSASVSLLRPFKKFRR